MILENIQETRERSRERELEEMNLAGKLNFELMQRRPIYTRLLAN